MTKSEVVIPIRGTKDRWPRDAGGDPCFVDLADLQRLFSLEQIVVMCNRYLKQQEYQSEASRAYFARKAAEKKAKS